MSKFDKTSAGERRPRAAQKKHGGGTLLGVFIGLVLGVVISFGVTLYLNKATLPFQDKYEGAPKTDPSAASAANGAQAPLPLPGKPGEKPAGQQRFEFYGLLEGKQPAVQGAVPPAAPAVAATPDSAPKSAPKEVLLIQVGAFQKAADADNLKAQLALSGLEASVQEVTIPEKGTLFRVRLGPYRDADELNQARVRLAQAGVQGTVVKP